MIRAAALAATLAAPAAAEDPRVWAVDPAASTIAFVYDLAGRPAEGAFRAPAGVGRFDPSDPGATQFTLEIPVADVDLGDPLWSAWALGPEWFDAAGHPTVRYRLARLTPLGPDLWEALGDVTIRGVTRILRTPVALTFGPDGARATGTLGVDRTEFGVGGASAWFVGVGPEIAVRFDIVARPEGDPAK